MSRNPYAPPTAAVADPPLPVSIPRPREVTLSVRLLWLSFALSCTDTIVRTSLDRDEDVMVQGLALVLVAINGAVAAWLIFKIAGGRNWARIAYTVLSVLGYVSMVTNWSTYLAAYHGEPGWIGLDILATLTDLGGLYLMFTKAANTWFKSRAAQ